MKVASCDSTNVNTGRHEGVIALLEQYLGHRLIWLPCMLHTNELSLRHLVVTLECPTTGDESFAGPIGTFCKKAQLPYLKEILSPSLLVLV